MGFSYQRYLVAMDDTLYRMANTAFDRMLQDPTHCRLPQLAGQRVRTVEVVVELLGRKPAAVVRTAFAVLAFDDTGCVDATRLREQQHARIENALAPVLRHPGVMKRSSTRAASSLRKAVHGRPRLHWHGP